MSANPRQRLRPRRGKLQAPRNDHPSERTGTPVFVFRRENNHESGNNRAVSPRRHGRLLRRTNRARDATRSAGIATRPVSGRVDATMSEEQSKGSTCYGAVAGRGGPARRRRRPLRGSQRCGQLLRERIHPVGSRAAGACIRGLEEGNQASAETSQSRRFADAVPIRRARQGPRFRQSRDGASAPRTQTARKAIAACVTILKRRRNPREHRTLRRRQRQRQGNGLVEGAKP